MANGRAVARVEDGTGHRPPLRSGCLDHSAPASEVPPHARAVRKAHAGVGETAAQSHAFCTSDWMHD
jgi:hypothetical protein